MPEPTGQISDAELVARMRSGDERALSDLYDRHATSLYSLAMSLVGNAADAEEVVADAFLRLWSASDYDVHRGTVGAYLAVVTRSRGLDRVRAQSRKRRADEAGAAANPSGFLLPVAAPADGPERALEVGEQRARVEDALASLTEKQRTVIDLAYFGGLSHREIAERLSEPLGTVKTRLRDGMQKLRDALPLTTTSAK